MKNFVNVLCGIVIVAVIGAAAYFISVAWRLNVATPIATHTRIEPATVVEVNDTLFVMETKDGHLWEAESNEAFRFTPKNKVHVVFDTLGTDDVTDDRIVKIFVETW